MRTNIRESGRAGFELIDLQTLLCVVDCGSFTLAAQQLRISQPTVSERIQRLETNVGMKLLTRTTRRVETTPAGVRLCAEARALLRGIDALMDDFREAALQQRARVTVATTPGIAAVLLPPLIRAFHEESPGYHVDMLDGQYEDVLRHIELGETDFAVVTFDGDSRFFEFNDLAEEEMVLVLPQGHPLLSGPINMTDLSGQQLMTLERYSLLSGLVTQACTREGVPPPHISKVENRTTLLGMVDAGNGLGFLPGSMASGSPHRDRVVASIADVKLQRHYGILKTRKLPLTQAALRFSDYLASRFPAAVERAGQGART
ncbi:LysR family transcriptional regulator [Caballeronia sp. LZ065]|uniref:LysR family transcriptional regulator n=1 Tax=Caballeronia sp. LZ065 TaxID=3038571 RepID=UPI00285BF39E|nr:LysR family transcriptional regulator [Caballeronia sp. LZ065]MDR5784630.1 LysR family transcriptional regulator [Caballeronia sp. LZ065]